MSKGAPAHANGFRSEQRDAQLVVGFPSLQRNQKSKPNPTTPSPAPSNVMGLIHEGGLEVSDFPPARHGSGAVSLDDLKTPAKCLPMCLVCRVSSRRFVDQQTSPETRPPDEVI